MSLQQLNPFNYHVSEIAKFLIALVGVIGYAVTVFVTLPGGLVVAVSALVVPVIGCITVFAWGNHDASAFNKAFIAFITAAITVADYWHKITPSTEAKIFQAVGALAICLGILFKSNATVGSRSRRAKALVANRSGHRA